MFKLPPFAPPRTIMEPRVVCRGNWSFAGDGKTEVRAVVVQVDLGTYCAGVEISRPKANSSLSMADLEPRHDAQKAWGEALHYHDEWKKQDAQRSSDAAGHPEAQQHASHEARA